MVDDVFSLFLPNGKIKHIRGFVEVYVMKEYIPEDLFCKR